MTPISVLLAREKDLAVFFECLSRCSDCEISTGITLTLASFCWMALATLARRDFEKFAR